MSDKPGQADHQAAPAETRAPVPRRSKWAVLYPNLYTWFVLVASLGVMCTYIVLHPVLFPAEEPAIADSTTGEVDALLFEDFASRGREVNWLAAWVIERGGMPGKLAYKFSLVMLVIVICEIVGRSNLQKGRRLAEWAIALTAIPVIVAMAQIYRDIYGH